MSDYMYSRGQAPARGGGGGRPLPVLPMGWQTAYTPNGDLYYVDHNTRTTHWELPKEVMQSINQNYRQGRMGRGIDRAKLKTKMCMNFQNGHCTWGSNCAFAHSTEELQAPPPNTRNSNRGGEMQEQANYSAQPPTF